MNGRFPRSHGWRRIAGFGVTGPGRFLLAQQISNHLETLLTEALSILSIQIAPLYISLYHYQNNIRTSSEIGLNLAGTDLSCSFFSSVSALSQSTSPSIIYVVRSFCPHH